jgi:glycosyltransferase involved in cell wall biosynthesis
MKKLVIVTDNFLPRWDGVSRFLLELMPALREKFEVTVICPDYGKLSVEGFKLVKVKLSKFKVGDYAVAKLNRQLIKKEIKKSDIVFSQTIGPVGALGIWYGSKYKKKVVSFVHSLEWELVPKATNSSLFKRVLNPFIKVYSRYLHNLCNLLILPSENTLENVSWSGLISKKKVINLGVDSSRFIPFNERTTKDQEFVLNLKKELGLENSFVIGNHGRIAREKDLYTLLNAYKWMKKVHDDCKLVIVGDGLDEIKQKLLRTEGVILTGAKDNVEIYLNLFDVYVTCSLTETTSLTTLESMSSGICTISTPVGFIKDYIKDNHNGFLFPTGNSYNLYKLLELVKANNSLRKEIGRRARRDISSKFDWNNTRKEIVETLEEV